MSKQKRAERPIRALSLASLLLVVAGAMAAIAQTPTKTPRRIKTPSWERLPAGIFFDDAFADGLRGPRPTKIGGANTAVSPPNNTAPAVTPSADDQDQWSTWISASTIEDELKAIHRRCTSSLRTEGHFRGLGNREIRPHFGTASFLFAVIEKFDADVRWQDSSPTARRLFIQTTNNMRRPNAQSFREAKQRQQELFDLIRGGRLDAKGADTFSWPEAADRKLMMQRLDISLKESLSPGTASQSEMGNTQEDLVREAEITAAIAHVLTQEAMEDGDDDEYREMCNQLKNAARDLLRAVKEDRLEAAQKAEGAIKNSCTNCHELYRA